MHVFPANLPTSWFQVMHFSITCLSCSEVCFNSRRYKISIKAKYTHFIRKTCKPCFKKCRYLISKGNSSKRFNLYIQLPWLIFPAMANVNYNALRQTVKFKRATRENCHEYTIKHTSTSHAKDTYTNNHTYCINQTSTR